MRRLSTGAKLAYGVGRLAEAVKARAFETFLFFYYVQVLELSGSLSGAALFVALCFDAVTDPLMGSISDGHDSRWGRRHPFMFASLFPLPVCFYLLFAPPAGLGQLGLFAWLATFAVLTRGAITLFHVPHLSLGAELSQDYDERTTIVAVRSLMGILGSAGAAAAGFFHFFARSPTYANGQMDAAAYPRYAVACAVAMAVSIFLCVLGTRGEIARLPAPPPTREPFRFPRVFQEMHVALGNRSFRALFIAVVLMFVTAGAHQALALHMGTYFWAFTPQQIGYYVFAMGGGALVAVPVAGPCHRLFDKKLTFILGYCCPLAFIIGPVLLRLAGAFPPNESPLVLRLILASMAIATFGSVLAGITSGSMMADVADEHELRSGRRQEGIFFGALSFSGKASSALGHALAGVGLDLIRWPQGAAVNPGDVGADTLQRLGVLFGPAVGIFSLAALVALAGYRISRVRHREIMAELDARRTETAAV